MKKILFTGLFVVLFAAGIAQKPYKIVFYNFENLFDTVRDPDIFDEEFTPGGSKTGIRPSTTRKSPTSGASCSTSLPRTVIFPSSSASPR